MGEKIAVAEYVDFTEPSTDESGQNQDSFPMIPAANPITDTLSNQVIAQDVKPFESFTPEALQHLDSLTDYNFSHDIENGRNHRMETFIQRNRQVIDILSILFCVSILIFFLVFGIYAHYL